MLKSLLSRVQGARASASEAMAAGWWQLRFFVLRALVVLAVLVTLLWVSLFMYGSFYYAYMPPVSHIRDVNLMFSTHCDSPGVLCSFPAANVSLVHDDHIQLLMQGQPYRVMLDLDMPESPVNQNLGMFMVSTQFYGRQGKILTSASRSVMLRYKSPLLQKLETLFFAPYLLFGCQEQKQTLTVVMFEKYQEDAYKSAMGVYVEVQTKRIEIYTATLRIHASFSGLRYFMYNWPVLSAIIGITLNMFFLAVMGLLSWWRLLVSTNESTESFKITKRKRHKKPLIAESEHEETLTNSDFSSESMTVPLNENEGTEENTPKPPEDNSHDTISPRTTKSDLEVDAETVGSTSEEMIDITPQPADVNDTDTELRLRKPNT